MMRQTVVCECARIKSAQYDSYTILVNNEVVYLALIYYNTNEARIYTDKVGGWLGTPMNPAQVRHQVLSTCLHHMYMRGALDFDKWEYLLDSLKFASLAQR